MIASVLLVILALCCCTSESNQFELDPPRLTGPSVALVDTIVEFMCEIPDQKINETILLRIFKKDEHNEVFGEFTLPVGEKIGVIPKLIKVVHEGYLECVATVQNNTEINATVSQAHFLKVVDQFQLDPPRLIGPSVALVNDVVVFMCEIPDQYINDTILLRIFQKDERNEVFGEFTLPVGEKIGVIPKIVQAVHEGYLECVATVQNNTEINATVSQAHFLKVVEPVDGAEIVNTGPTELLEGDSLNLLCKVAFGNHLSYKWFLNGHLVTLSPFHWMGDNQLIISRVSSKDSGSYVCLAENFFNVTSLYSSNSSAVVITVRELLSTPDISYTVVKMGEHNYIADITCRCARGDPPITFSLYMGDELIDKTTSSERQSTISIPVVMDQQSEWLRCQAKKDEQTENSRWLSFEIVSVAAPVTVHSDYDMAKNYAIIGLRLYCKAARGTHPHFQWYLNQKPLHDRGSFYYVFDQPPERSVLLLSVGRRSSGNYHCEVWDSFDNSTVISSKRLYVDKEVLNRLPTSVVAVVFSCFTLLILLVVFCCLSGVIFRRKQSQQKSELSLEMDFRFVASEDEMDLGDYSEDPDVVRAPQEDELYQESEASEDEWLQIEQERSTLEN